ncbi:MAG: hypothetical protein F4X17_16425 [Gemmatimonadetes bacterium]|nr:hypothetical protein [Gemmatimonadota bacterium]
MHIAFVMLLIASASFAQSPSFRAPDKAMEPALVSGSSYALSSADSLRRGRIAVFVRNGQRVARRIAGVPNDRQMTQDREFTKRALSSWQFISIDDNKIVFLSQDTPMSRSNPPMTLADLSSYTSVMQAALDTYESQPILGHGKYYVHADTRSTLVDGTAVTFEDSREWGTIDWANIVGVILPADEEEE